MVRRLKRENLRMSRLDSLCQKHLFRNVICYFRNVKSGWCPNLAKKSRERQFSSQMQELEFLKLNSWMKKVTHIQACEDQLILEFAPATTKPRTCWVTTCYHTNKVGLAASQIHICKECLVCQNHNNNLSMCWSKSKRFWVILPARRIVLTWLIWKMRLRCWCSSTMLPMKSQMSISTSIIKDRW